MSQSSKLQQALIYHGKASIPIDPTDEQERKILTHRARETLYRAGRAAGLKVKVMSTSNCVYGFARRDA